MTLFENLKMKESIENDVENHLDKRDLKIANSTFKITYFMQEHKLEKSIIQTLFNECEIIFGDMVELLEDNKIFIDIPSRIRDDKISRVNYYSLYLDIHCYNSLIFSIRDCTIVPVIDIIMNNTENDYIRNHFKDKIDNNSIEGLIKISDMVKSYDKMLRIFHKCS